MVNEQPRLTRDVRRAALQTMYQYDSNAESDSTDIRASLEGSAGNPDAHERGYDLGAAAWNDRARADEMIGPLTPSWPIHRQPIVDRSLLRLALHEMLVVGTPPKVVINEAVELAKEFSTEKSPMFINGVLDKLHRQMNADDAPDETPATEPESETTAATGDE